MNLYSFERLLNFSIYRMLDLNNYSYKIIFYHKEISEISESPY